MNSTMHCDNCAVVELWAYGGPGA